MNYLHPSEIERLSHLSNHPFDEIRADSLTPSDYVLLGGLRWDVIPRSGRRKLRHLPGTTTLANAIATAVLVNEKAGNISLHLSKSRYTRFNRFQHVEATFLRWQHRWPADSLEGHFAASGKVLDLLSAFAENDSGAMRPAITDRLLRLMAGRGLIRQETERYRLLRLLPRSRKRYVVGPQVWQALQAPAAAVAERFVSSSAETRPELTEELLRDINALLSA